MSLTKYGDTTFLNYKQNWFVWEPSWEMFRPITACAWNGTEYEIVEREYCADPMDPLYGFGTPQMKQVCDALTTTYASQLANAKLVTTPSVGPTEWMFDRVVAVTPCAPRDRDSWKRMVRGRTRTLRRAPRNKLTRRFL
jgi:hypothetical protein